MDLQLAEKKVLDALTGEFVGIPFTPKRFFNGSANMLEVTADNINLDGVYDNIYLSFGISEHGIVFNSMIFDKLPISETTLKLINTFNASEPHYKAYINNNGYFALEASHSVLSEDEYARLAIQFMRRGGYLKDDEALKEITKLLIK